MSRLPILLALLLVAASPAAAGWLVTHDGNVLKTAGGWRVDGALVVFTAEDGRLSSIRVREVDLEASLARGAEPASAAAPMAEPTAPNARPVLVLTDDDVGHVRSARDFEPEPDGSGLSDQPPADAAEPARAGSVVEVVDWRERVDVESNSLRIEGTVTNRGPGLATNTQVEVRLLDDSGELLERRQATLREPTMRPGAIVPFTASFSGSPGFVTIEFDVRSRGFKLRPASESPASPDQ